MYRGEKKEKEQKGCLIIGNISVTVINIAHCFLELQLKYQGFFIVTLCIINAFLFADSFNDFDIYSSSSGPRQAHPLEIGRSFKVGLDI